jgi:hypothetical protein
VTDPENLNKVLIDITSATPRSVGDVVERLEAVQQNAETREPRYHEDGVACFNYLYAMVTRDVRDKLQQGGYFVDHEFLSTLDVEFAKRYLSAVGGHAASLPTPSSWSVLFHHRDAMSVKPIQFAVAGVNAHVNYDLAFALVETCRALGQPLGQGSQHDDYLKINEIFAYHMRELRQHFEDKFQREIDRWFVAGLADDAGDLTVVLARDAAWRRAERLWALRENAEEMAKEDKAIDWRVSMTSRGILAFRLI